jgi:hypothetical protein
MSEPQKGDIIISRAGEFLVTSRDSNANSDTPDIQFRAINYGPLQNDRWERIKNDYRIKQMGGRKTRRHRKKSHRRHKKSHRR